jgi:hypothetical protein
MPNVNLQSPPPGNGWNEWGKHVLRELERLNDCYDDLKTDVSNVRIEIAMLKIKAGVWGLIGGAIPVLITVILYLLQTVMQH